MPILKMVGQVRAEYKCKHDYHKVTSQWYRSIDVEATWPSEYFANPSIVPSNLELSI